MTIATDNGGRQRTPTDGLSQATDAAALAVRVCTWLRDEEASASDRTARHSAVPSAVPSVRMFRQSACLVRIAAGLSRTGSGRCLRRRSGAAHWATYAASADRPGSLGHPRRRGGVAVGRRERGVGLARRGRCWPSSPRVCRRARRVVPWRRPAPLTRAFKRPRSSRTRGV